MVRQPVRYSAMLRIGPVRCCPVVVALLILIGTAAHAAAQDLDLVDATLIDGTGAAPRTGVSVRVRGGRIVSIDAVAPTPTPGTRRIDLRGRVVLPGLIDAHAHIAVARRRAPRPRVRGHHGADPRRHVSAGHGHARPDPRAAT